MASSGRLSTGPKVWTLLWHVLLQRGIIRTPGRFWWGRLSVCGGFPIFPIRLARRIGMPTKPIKNRPQATSLPHSLGSGPLSARLAIWLAPTARPGGRAQTRASALQTSGHFWVAAKLLCGPVVNRSVARLRMFLSHRRGGLTIFARTRSANFATLITARSCIPSPTFSFSSYASTRNRSRRSFTSTSSL